MRKIKSNYNYRTPLWIAILFLEVIVVTRSPLRDSSRIFLFLVTGLLVWIFIGQMRILISSMMMNLPAKSKYNHYDDVIEIHINRMCKGSKKKCAEYCALTIITALRLNKDVIFYTYLFHPRSLNKLFGDAIEIQYPEKFDWFVNFAASYLYGYLRIGQKTKPFIKAHIDIKKLDEDTISKLYKLIDVK